MAFSSGTIIKYKYLKSCAYLLVILFPFYFAACSAATETNRSSPSVEDYLEKGDLFFNDGQFHEALDHYLQAAGIEKDNPLIYYKIGLVYGTLHSHENTDRSLISGSVNRLSRKEYREDSHFNNALHYFQKAADLGHQPSGKIIRAMYDNIQHRDVKY